MKKTNNGMTVREFVETYLLQYVSRLYIQWHDDEGKFQEKSFTILPQIQYPKITIDELGETADMRIKDIACDDRDLILIV